MKKYAALLAGLVLAACHAMTIPADAATTPVYSYNLLNGNAGGNTVSPVAGDYQVILGGTYNGATLTLYQTVNSLVTTIATYTSTPGTTPCITIPAGANMQMTVTGGPPSGMTAVLGGVGVGGCGSGGGTGDVTGPGSSTNGNFASFNGTDGSTIQDSTYSSASFAPAGVVTVLTGSNPTTNAAAWAAFTQYTIGGSGRTITLPASSGLSANGGLQIDTNTNSATLAATSPDTITFNGSTTGSGGSVTLPAKGLYSVSTDGAGKIYVSASAPQVDAVTTSLSSANVLSANYPTPTYVANRWYSIYPGQGAAGNNPTATVIHWQRMYVYRPVTFGTWGLRVTTLFASGNIYIACYDSTGTGGGPGQVLGSLTSGGGGFSTTTATIVSKAMSCAFPTAGWYWIGSIHDNTTSIAYSVATAQALDGYYYGGTAQNQFGGSTTTVATDYQTTGATPGTWSANPTLTIATGPTNAVNPYLVAQVSSIP